MKKYNVSFSMDFEVEADSYEEAKKIAASKFNYLLNNIGYDFDITESNDIEFDEEKRDIIKDEEKESNLNRENINRNEENRIWGNRLTKTINNLYEEIIKKI